MQDIVLDSINTAQDYLPKLQDGFSKISTYYRNGKNSKAMELFPYAIEGLDWFLHVAEAILAFYGDEIDEIKNGLMTFSDVVNNLSEAWASSDYSVTADIIDNDLIPHLEKWGKLVNHLLSDDN